MLSPKVYKSIETQTDVNKYLQNSITNLTPPMVVHGQNPSKVSTHCHHPQTEEVDIKARNKLYLACGMCLFLMAVEIIGDILSNSLAVALDASHLCTDLASFMIALFTIWIARRPATQRLNFGWYRAEVIGALLSIFLIWLMTSGLCYLAVQRILEGSFEINPVIMMITSGTAILGNFIVGLLLYVDMEFCNKCGCSKKTDMEKQKYHPILIKLASSDACLSTENFLCTFKSQGTQTFAGLNTNYNRKQYLPLKAAFLNALGDMIQSIGVFLAGLIIYYEPNWLLVDPILTFIFAFIVLITTLGIIRQALLVLMESTPTYLDNNEVKQLFESIEGVKSVHNLRIWALNLDKIACLVHLEIEENSQPKKILEQANYAIHQRYNFFETTIQIE